VPGEGWFGYFRLYAPAEAYYMLPVGKNFGLRFEARGYATLLNNSGGMFCSSNGGCVVSIKGTALYQGEALIGLSGRF